MTTKICEYCGKEFPIRVSDVNRGRGRFCGKSCAASGINGNRYRHGLSGTKEYRAWNAMINRTTNKNYHAYKDYGARGIKVCDRWLHSFENFFDDMGYAPTPSHSVDRIDNNKGYSPNNCRWATKIEQAANRRVNRFITYNNETHYIEEWGRITNIGGVNIIKRLERGWSIEKALTTPKLR